MGNARLVLTRDVTRTECPWLERDYPAGTFVYAYSGPTYGCVSRDGRAVTERDDETPFMELPADALGEHPGTCDDPAMADMAAALQASITAIDDWLHQYASEMCGEEHVRETAARIRDAGGTIAYIAGVQEKNRSALALARPGS